MRPRKNVYSGGEHIVQLASPYKEGLKRTVELDDNQGILIGRELVNGIDWYVIRAGEGIETWLKESFLQSLDFLRGDSRDVFYITERVYMVLSLKWDRLL